jgi:DNA invertase Pin-like site-specific DNA recombinase
MSPEGSTAIGYIRVSTREQGLKGQSLAAQRRTIREECKRRGWKLLDIVEDTSSGRTERRPGLQGLLARLDRRQPEADVLVVTKIDRLARSVVDFGIWLRRAERRGFAVRMLDLDIDTSTPGGKMIAHVIASVAEWERDMIAQRTKEGLAEAMSNGARPGRRPTVPDSVVTRIRRERAADASWQTIANGLNADGVPTGQGGSQWFAASTRKVALRPV